MYFFLIFSEEKGTDVRLAIQTYDIISHSVALPSCVFYLYRILATLMELSNGEKGNPRDERSGTQEAEISVLLTVFNSWRVRRAMSGKILVPRLPASSSEVIYRDSSFYMIRLVSHAFQWYEIGFFHGNLPGMPEIGTCYPTKKKFSERIGEFGYLRRRRIRKHSRFLIDGSSKVLL